jgi:hypothetical protein
MLHLIIALLAQIIPGPETVGWTYYPTPLSALENPAPPLVILTPDLPLYVPAPWCAGCPVIVYSPRPLTVDDLRVGAADRPELDLVPEELFRWVDAENCTHLVNRIKTPFEEHNYAVRTCPVTQ